MPSASSTDPVELALSLGLREELRERRYCDAVLHCHNDDLIYTHRLILASISPLLAKALVESDSNEVDEYIHISIPDVNGDEMSSFISHMHIGGLEEVQLAHNLMFLGVVQALATEYPTNEFADAVLANTTSVINDLSFEDPEHEEGVEGAVSPDEEYNTSLNHIALKSDFQNAKSVRLTNTLVTTVEQREQRILEERKLQALQRKKRRQQQPEPSSNTPTVTVCKQEPVSSDETFVVITGDDGGESEPNAKIVALRLHGDNSDAVTLHDVEGGNESISSLLNEESGSDQSNLTPTKRSKLMSKRSPVWQYFLALSKTSAKCKLCLATFAINNSTTTNLTRHLERKHKQEGVLVNSRIQERKEMIREAEEETQRSTLVSVEEVDFAKVSPIWSHFDQLTISQVQCQHCDQVVKIVNSSTSAPLRHLRRQHPEIATKLYSERENIDLQSPEKIDSSKNASSMVTSIWKFFERRSASKSAICTTCQLPIYLGEDLDLMNIKSEDSQDHDIGPLSHLVDHLRNTHNDLFTAFESAVKNQKSIRRRVRMFNASSARPRSALHFYFTFDEDKKSASCKACLQSLLVKSSKKGTLGLKRHLRAQHWRLYEQYLRDVGKEQYAVSPAKRKRGTVEQEPNNEESKASKVAKSDGDDEKGDKNKDNDEDDNNNVANRTCEQCGKIYATRKGLLVHLQAVHSGERPYSCDECGMRFARKESWRRHSHSTDRPYLCSICGKTFAKKHVRNVHEKNHINGKRYLCNICNKTFSTNQRLQLHQRVHTGEKPFECHYSECGKRFAQKHHLVTHIRTHTGEKPYECPTCHQMFKHLSTKAKHNCMGQVSVSEDSKMMSSQPIQVYEDEAHQATISIIRTP